MIWQDAVIATGQVLFIVALLPALWSSDKPPRSTCLLTGSVLAVFALTFLTLGLWFGAFTAAGCAFCWFVLLAQKRARSVGIKANIYRDPDWCPDCGIDNNKFHCPPGCPSRII